MLVGKDRERECRGIGVLSGRQVQVGSTALECCRENGQHSKGAKTFRTHDEGR